MTAKGGETSILWTLFFAVWIFRYPCLKTLETIPPVHRQIQPICRAIQIAQPARAGPGAAKSVSASVPHSIALQPAPNTNPHSSRRFCPQQSDGLYMRDESGSDACAPSGAGRGAMKTRADYYQPQSSWNMCIPGKIPFATATHPRAHNP